jgi:hypothetical protein
MIQHSQAPACEPVYSDDGQSIEYYNTCNDRTCATHPEHSAAESSQRRT